MKMKERVAEVIENSGYDECLDSFKGVADNILKSMYEPDPHAVVIVADKLELTATQVAAVWMLLIEEHGK